MPMLRLLIPFILGIILQNKIQFPFLLISVLCVITFLITLFIWKYEPINFRYNLRWLYGLILYSFIMLFSMCIMERSIEASSFMDHSEKGGYVVARVLETPSERERRFRILIEPFKVISDKSIIKTSGRAIGWFEKDSCAGKLRAGDRIIFRNNFREIKNSGNPFEFDYSRYMRIQQVFGEIYLASDQWFIQDNEGADSGRLLMFSGRLREHLLGVMKNNGIGGREYEVAGALLLGHRDGLDPETRHSYAASGAMHILAVSGLHVGILYIFLHRMLGFMKRPGYLNITRSILILLVIWLYALLTGLSPSVTRSATMFSFVAVSGTVSRSANIFNTLASAAFVQLLINPLNLFLVGFQLSYLAVAGIAFYQPLISSLVSFRNVLTNRIWALATVSFSAQLIIFPLIIFYFNQFPNYFLLTNIFAVPLAMIILYSGLFLFLLSSIPILAFVLAFVLNIGLFLLNFLTDTISYLPFSHTSDIVTGMPLLLVLYGIILFSSLFFIMRKPRLLQYAFILAIAGFAIKADHKIRTSGQNIFIVYNAGRSSLYNFVSGDNNYIVSGTDSEADSKILPYPAVRPALYLNAGNVRILSAGNFFNSSYECLHYPLYVKGNFVVFNRFSIYFACSDEINYTHSLKPVYTDLLVISSRFSSDISEICKTINPAKVVIDSSVPYYRKEEIIAQCSKIGLEYHDVSASGAFIVELNK